MKVSHEIQALESMGIDTLKFIGVYMGSDPQ